VLTKDQNDLLTQTGPGTPAGALMRAYWQPVGLSEEIPVGSPPKPVRILSEDLVLFRDETGQPALMGLFCPHRGVDLSYGRIEAGGLRCLYHGWVIDRDGRCLAQPGEPAGSTFKDRVRHVAYPCHEVNGIIWGYLGAGEPPPFPKFSFADAPAESIWVTKLLNECNYLQASEGNVDPQHLSFLHRFEDTREAFRDSKVVTHADPAPKLIVEDTAFGSRTYSVRDAGNDEVYVRISNFVMPNGSLFDGVPVDDPARTPPVANAGCQAHWHVPIDDTSHYKYVIVQRYHGALDRAYLDRSIKGEVDEQYNALRRKANRYLQDRTEMRSVTFAGLGSNFQIHDRYATETQGPIFDRSKERLGASDAPVIAMRRQMLRTIADHQAGRAIPMQTRDGENPVADLIVRSQRISKDAPVSGFYRSVETFSCVLP
jgi:phthalate 4,5-dioxygenase